MQTPQGYKLVDGRFEPVDWLAIVFNPSFPYRLLHNVTAFYITTAFVVMGVGAWLLRRNRAVDDLRMMVRMALNLLIIWSRGDFPRRFAWAQYARTPASQARGDGGAVRYR